MRLQTKYYCFLAFTFLLLLVIPLESTRRLPTEDTWTKRYLTCDFTNSETLTLVIQDRESTTDLQIPFEFGIYEIDDGFFSVGVGFDPSRVNYRKDLRTLHTEFMKSNIDHFPFLYINGTEEFDYWTSRTPNMTFIEADGYLSDGSVGWIAYTGNLTQSELEDVTCIGYVISIFNMNTTFRIGEGDFINVVYRGVIPNRITFGINFTLLEGNVWSPSLIYESSDPSNLIVEGNTITAFFAESLPADPVFQIGITVITISIIGIASVFIYVKTRKPLE